MASNIQAEPKADFDLSLKTKAIFKCYLFHFLENLIDQGADYPPPDRKELKKEYELFTAEEFAAISDAECRKIAKAGRDNQREHLDDFVSKFIKAYSKLCQEDKNEFIGLFGGCFFALDIRNVDGRLGGRYTLAEGSEQFLWRVVGSLGELSGFQDLRYEDLSFEDRVDTYISSADRKQAGMAKEPSETSTLDGQQSRGSLSRSSAFTNNTAGSGSIFDSVRDGRASDPHALLSPLT